MIRGVDFGVVDQIYYFGKQRDTPTGFQCFFCAGSCGVLGGEGGGYLCLEELYREDSSSISLDSHYGDDILLFIIYVVIISASPLLGRFPFSWIPVQSLIFTPISRVNLVSKRGAAHGTRENRSDL